MSIRLQDVLLYGGGECFQKFGVPFMRMGRAQDVAATFTRSGAVGPFVGKDGVLRRASANRLRTDWVDTDDDDANDALTLLLEAARTNLIDDDNLNNWTASGTPVIAATDGPDGGASSAYTVEDDTGGAQEDVSKASSSNVSAGTPTAVFVVRENIHPASSTRLFATTPTDGTVLSVDIDSWTDGEPSLTANTGTVLGKRLKGDGYWAIYCRATTVTGSEAMTMGVRPAEGAANTGAIDVYRVNVYDNAVPLHSIVDAGETKAVETLYSDFLHAPQEMTGYLKIRPVGVEQTSNLGLLRIGDATASTGAGIEIYTASAKRMRLTLDNGVDATAAATFGASGEIDYLDDVELRYVIGSDGALTFEVAVSEVSAETVTASALASGLPDAFAGTRIYHGSLGSSNQGLVQILASKIAKGTQSMADMRALFAYDSARAVA